MKLESLRPILWVPDVRASADWYVTELGFELDEYSEEGQWASLHREGVALMLTKPNEHMPLQGPAFSGSFYFRTNDVEGWWHHLKDRADMLYPIEDFPWEMREFAVKDLNGYILQFGQDITI